MSNDPNKASLQAVHRRQFFSGALLVGGAAIAASAARAAAVTASSAADVMAPIAVPAQAPAKTGTATLPGTRLYYWDTESSGQPVVLVHPATGSALIWVYQQPVLAAAGYRVIAYSRRGHANSDPVVRENPGTPSGDLHNLVEFLGVRKFHLVGSAAGGAICMDYALSRPDRLYSLTIACAVGGVLDEDYLKMGAQIRPPGYADMPPEFREVSPSYRAINPEGTKAWVDLEKRAVTGNRIGPENTNRITWASLATVRVPTLVMGGDADLGVPPPMVRAYAAHIPGSELMIVPEVGHSLYWERPDIFNRALLDFFRRHSA